MSVHEQGLGVLISGASSTPSNGVLSDVEQKIMGRVKDELLPWALGGMVLTILGVTFTSWLICHRTGRSW
jgi:hypothetical protein